MWNWKDQNIEMLSEAGFKVSDPGPLHAPILSFKQAANDVTRWSEVVRRANVPMN